MSSGVQNLSGEDSGPRASLPGRWPRSWGLAQAPGGRIADVGLAALVVLIVVIMIVPLPAPLLDVLLVINLAVGVLMLLIGMYIPNGLAFAAMPAILLVTTLFRLALNISATRLILSRAYAGRVILAFGEAVVQGNYAVGAVVFLILIIVQYLVVARGSERVAEVGARFTLDAMPGRQMAIDADLRSGALSVEQARRGRGELRRESQFYGAMDGAMKFVKGDAIASIIITAINFIAGVGIGVGMRGMGAMESLRLYGLLTVGAGLVIQIASLLVSTSAGVVVTRVASEREESSLGADIGAQLFGNPRLLAVGAILLAALALAPGLPAAPFLIVASLTGALAYGLFNLRARQAIAGRQPREPGSATAPLSAEAPVAIELGEALAGALLGAEPNCRALDKALAEIGDRIYADLGVSLPEARIRLNHQFKKNAYQILLQQLPAAEGVIELDRVSAADAPILIARDLEAAARRRPQDLVGVQEAQNMLDALGRSCPALVRGVTPSPISLPLLTEVLRRLVAEKVSIRPLREILEALILEPLTENDPGALVERVRARLARYITHSYSDSGALAVHQLDAEIEEAVRDGVQKGPAGFYLALPPELARNIIDAIAAVCSGPDAGAPPILLTQPDVRRHLRRLIETELPQVAVLSHAELAPEVALKPLKQVSITRGPGVNT